MGEGKQEDEFGCVYSRCIRQRLLNLSRTQEWHKHGVKYGRDVPGDYPQLLLRSLFCLVLPGGWAGGRMVVCPARDVSTSRDA